MRGLYVGRFQPFHKGHLRVIKKALEEVDEVIIVVGSSAQSFTQDNPLTAGERIEIIKETLRSEGIANNYYLIPIPDIDTNAVWVSHVEMNVPKFDIVFTGADITNTLFSEKGYKTKVLDRWNQISASKVRDSIINSEEWEDLVPKKTLEKLNERKFVERIKQIVNQD